MTSWAKFLTEPRPGDVIQAQGSTGQATLETARSATDPGTEEHPEVGSAAREREGNFPRAGRWQRREGKEDGERDGW
jgi:hypothetical protein